MGRGVVAQSANYMRKAIIDNKDVINLHSEGLSSSKIAAFFNTSIGNIRDILNNNGLKDNIYINKIKSYDHLIAPVKELYQKGVPKKKIARDLNTYFNVVNNIIKDNNISNSIIEGSNRCCTCRKVLPLSMFHNNRSGKYGKNHRCKECKKNEPSRKEYLKKWRLENKQLKSDLDKQYRLKNIDKIKEYRKSDKYKIIKAKSDKRYYEKAIKSPEIKMAMRMRSMISEYAKHKTDKTFKMLGYSSVDLVNHLESKFVNGMSWDNYGRGGWHIDHIRPIASFATNKPSWLNEAFSLNNLQPLYESDNCSKGSLYNGVRYNGKSSKK
jgi:hypothetical protein